MHSQESSDETSYPPHNGLPWGDSRQEGPEQEEREAMEAMLRQRRRRKRELVPVPSGRALLEVAGSTEGSVERLKREAAQRVETASKWGVEKASDVYRQGKAIATETVGWLTPAHMQWRPRVVDWEKELFLPEEREQLKAWREKGLRPPLDWDGEIHTRVTDYVSEVTCKGPRDALTACYERNYTHLSAKRCGNRMRWFKQCVRSAVQRTLPDWGDLAPAPSLQPELSDDFEPRHMRWPPTPPNEYYVFPSAAFREELWDALGSWRMDSFDINAWPVPFMHAFREELGVPDWFFDFPTAFGPATGPIDGQSKHRELYPNLHAETENWPNEYADEYVHPGLWVNTDARASGPWKEGLENTCDARDPYCRSSRQVLKYRMNPWNEVIIPERRQFSTADIRAGRF